MSTSGRKKLGARAVAILLVIATGCFDDRTRIEDGGRGDRDTGPVRIDAHLDAGVGRPDALATDGSASSDGPSSADSGSDGGAACVRAWPDRDVDGAGDGSALPELVCTGVFPPMTAGRDDDCDDADAATGPDAPERCNGADDDCDGIADDGLDGCDPVIDVAPGWLRSCVLHAGGRVRCWGSNRTWGGLGDGSTVDVRLAPGDGATLDDATAISNGTGSICAIRRDGSVWCWGENNFGQLGDGTSTQQPSPVLASIPERVVAIEAGAHACGVTETSHLYCWGNNVAGQLGDGTFGDYRIRPGLVDGIDDVIAVAVGSAHTCAIRGDETVWCWGSNVHGQLGDGSTRAHLTPQMVPGIGPVSQIAASGLQTCAVLRDGTMVCWGQTSSGEEVLTPRLVEALDDVRQGEVGGAVLADGSAWCWGQGDYGELGNGLLVDSAGPVGVVGIGPARLIRRHRNSCALLRSGEVACWGWRPLGDGLAPDTTEPHRVALDPVVDVAVGDDHACGRTALGSLWCWGEGLDERATLTAPSPIAVGGAINLVAAGTRHACAVRATGGTVCWGELYDRYYADPTPVPGETETPTALAAAGVSTAVVRDGHVFDYFSFPPTEIRHASGPMTDAVGVAVGWAGHGCAVRVGGVVSCWGGNGDGQLGDGTTTARWTAVDAVGLDAAQAVGTGNRTSCALEVDGRVRCWGRGYGLTPVEVLGAGSAMQLSVGADHACVIRDPGQVWCWGSNADGQLGDGSTTDSRTPVRVLGLSTATGVAAGGHGTCAVTSAGSVFCWGAAENGLMGNGETVGGFSATPALVVVVPTLE